MNYESRKIYGEMFWFFLISVQWTAIYSAKDDDKVSDFQNNDNLLPQTNLGEYCWVEPCENQFFNGEFICQCRSGYKIHNNECIPVSGENKLCTKQEDCCGKLICINGICKKPVPTNEFVTLAKICLGITIMTIIIAVISFLYKCFIKNNYFQASQRQNDTSSLNSSSRFRNRVICPRSSVSVTEEEKPPSYEECMHSTEKGVAAQPPPYVISTNPLNIIVENPSVQPINLPVADSLNLTSLNVQTLNYEINSKARITQSFEKIHTAAKLSSR